MTDATDKLFEAVHKFAAANGYPRTPKQYYPDGARAKLLEAVDAYYDAKRTRELEAQRPADDRLVAVLRAKAAVCDAHLEDVANPTLTTVMRLKSARAALRELEAKS